MTAGRIDLRKLTGRIASLAEVRRAAVALMDETAYQPPLIQNADPHAGGYYLAPASGLEQLRAAIASSEAADTRAGTPRANLRLLKPADLEAAERPAPALEIWIPFTPDRNNATNRQTRHARYQYRDSGNKREKQRVCEALAEWQTEAPRFVRHVAVEVEIRWGKSLHAGPSQARMTQDGYLDADGAAGALKSWLDALTESGIWADDRLAARDLRIRQARAADGSGYTTVRIWESEPAGAAGDLEATANIAV